MQFLCDQMLAALGKWLRIAGYDTQIIATRIDDREILERAIKENRLLITRDRHFLEMKSSKGTVLFLSTNSLEEWVGELNRLLKIDWLYHPFSRCLKCNTFLIIPDEEMITRDVPMLIRLTQSSFWYCPKCQRIYWQGSHTQRMAEQLHKWQEL